MTHSGEQRPPTAPLPAAPPAAPRHRIRRALTATLIVIAAILGPVAVTGLWARAMVNNTDTYLDAVGPLATDPAVVAALEDRVTGAVMDAVDSLDVGGQVQEFLTSRGMPNRLATLVTSALAGLNSNLRDLVSRTVATVIEDPGFATVWQNLNRAGHQALVRVVDGDSQLLDSQGNLALQLQPVIDAVKQRLIDNGHSWASLLPGTLTAEWVLVPADQVNNVRHGLDALRTVAIVVVVVELVVIAGAVVLSSDRMRGVSWIAFGLAAGSLALLGTLRYLERSLVGDYPRFQHPDAVTAMVQTITGALVDWLRLTFAVGLVVAIGAALLGRGRWAIRARAQLAGFRITMTHPPYSGPRRIAAAVVATGCALVLVFASDPSPFAVGALLFGVLLGAVLALIPGATEQRTNS